MLMFPFPSFVSFGSVCFKTKSHLAHFGLFLCPRTTLNFKSCCFNLSSAEITDRRRHTQVCGAGDGCGAAFYQLPNPSPSPPPRAAVWGPYFQLFTETLLPHIRSCHLSLRCPFPRRQERRLEPCPGSSHMSGAWPTVASGIPLGISKCQQVPGLAQQSNNYRICPITIDLWLYKQPTNIHSVTTTTTIIIFNWHILSSSLPPPPPPSYHHHHHHQRNT